MVTKTTTPTDRIAELHQAELQLSRKLLTLRSDLAAMTRPTGASRFDEAALLASGTARSTLLAQIDALDRAIDDAREERRAVIKAGLVGRAAQMLDEAAALRAERERILSRRAQLVSELLELEGLDEAAAVFVPVQRPFKNIGPGLEVKVTRVRSDDLLRKAEVLERTARPTYPPEPTDSGSVTATGRAALVELIVGLPSTLIGPRLDQALAWHDERHSALCAAAGVSPAAYPDLKVELHWSRAGVSQGSPAELVGIAREAVAA